MVQKQQPSRTDEAQRRAWRVTGICACGHARVMHDDEVEGRCFGKIVLGEVSWLCRCTQYEEVLDGDASVQGLQQRGGRDGLSEAAVPVQPVREPSLHVGSAVDGHGNDGDVRSSQPVEAEGLTDPFFHYAEQCRGK